METLKKITTTNWTKTLLMIKKGEVKKCEITADEANRLRVRACELTKRGKGDYSVSIEGNIAIISNK